MHEFLITIPQNYATNGSFLLKGWISLVRPLNYNLHISDRLSCIDIVEINSDLGTQKEADRTLIMAAEVITACFGKRRMVVPDGYQLKKVRNIVKNKS